MTGMGKIASASIISNLPELGYMNSKQASSLVGVAPMNREMAVIKVKEKFREEGIKFVRFYIWR